MFDTDAFGNGTSDVIRRNLYVSAVERVLATRQQALGGGADALPTLDMARCLEEEFQECENSHAAHLAYHDLEPHDASLASLLGSFRSERRVAGRVMDFVRNNLQIASFDHVAVFQACPEFLALVSEYPCHRPAQLISPTAYPTFQALESAVGFCLHGCVECVVAPEQNIHGILTAKETVNKLLLDSAYRTLVCESGTPRAGITYPGNGPGRTVPWPDLAMCVAAALGQTDDETPMTVELPSAEGTVRVIVVPQAVPAGWYRVFRTGWELAGPPPCVIRPCMSF